MHHQQFFITVFPPVNSSAGERTALIGGEKEGGAAEGVEVSTHTTSHMKMVGKGEQVDVEVT